MADDSDDMSNYGEEDSEEKEAFAKQSLKP
jgi:hypothetical protein